MFSTILQNFIDNNWYICLSISFFLIIIIKIIFKVTRRLREFSHIINWKWDDKTQQTYFFYFFFLKPLSKRTLQLTKPVSFCFLLLLFLPWPMRKETNSSSYRSNKASSIQTYSTLNLRRLQFNNSSAFFSFSFSSKSSHFFMAYQQSTFFLSTTFSLKNFPCSCCFFLFLFSLRKIIHA